MSSAPQGLHFDNPPLIETALSVEFAPIKGWGIHHYGLLWQLFRDNFPIFQAHPPIVNAGSMLPPTDNPFGEYVRGWFTDRSGNRLIQIQYDRIIYNWRRITGTEEYPHYDNVRKDFAQTWAQLSLFLRDQGLDQPIVQRCGVTYVNNLPMDQWRNGVHLGGLTNLTEPADVQNLSVNYVLPNSQESLGLVLQPVVRLTDAVQFQQFQLVSSMQPKSSGENDVLTALDRGHDWIIRVFTNFTTEEMQAQWSLKDRA